jgi:sterol desaturase/sphingolipid hydroxylase (fatty acid hydroxylase superfamily)
MRHPTLQAVVIGFIVLTIAFRLLELTRAKDKRLAWFRAGYFTDVAYWAFTPFVTRAVTGLAVAVAVAPVAYSLWGRIDRDLIMHGWGPAASLPLWAQAVGLLVIGDLIGYWTHRAFHRGLLWRLHAVHHSSRDLDWLSAVRLHPVNDALTRLASTVPLLLTGFAPIALAGIAPLLTLLAILVHANVDWGWGPFRSVIASPRFHRWHHTSEEEGLDKNFAGLLPLWDIVFGTYYMPKDRLPARFGTDIEVPAGLFGQLAFPFRRTPL